MHTRVRNEHSDLSNDPALNIRRSKRRQVRDIRAK